ncbi:MAG TPA: universal stress protein [Thermomicrobiaceae bacterium]|nr:universal stress protein [Thermomicrobiaceae bacterium]
MAGFSNVSAVVVPLDGSELAESALPYAVELARLFGARVVLLRVLEEMRPLYDARRHEVVWLDPANPHLHLLSPELLKPEVDRLTAAGIAVEPVVRLGDPRVEIIREAAEQPDRLVVLASHGRGGLGRVVLGSTATRVLQLAPVPVLVVRARGRADQPDGIRFGRIVVPLDGSSLGEQALLPAVELTRRSAATLELVRVAETYRDELPDLPPSMLTSPSYRDIVAQFAALEREAGAYLDGIADRLAADEVAATTEVLSGDPARQLLAYAERESPDLVVMTSHGRGGLARWFFGSVTDKLLTASRVPVLIVRTHEPDQA